jgi:hypothetical protein
MLKLNNDYSTISVNSNNKTFYENVSTLNVERGIPFILEYTDEEIIKNYVVLKDIIKSDNQNNELIAYNKTNILKIETNSLLKDYEIIMGIELLDTPKENVHISLFVQIIKPNGEPLTHYNTIDNMELRITLPNSKGKILDVYRKYDNKWYNIYSPITYIGNDTYSFGISRNLEYELRDATVNDDTSSVSSDKIFILILLVILLLLLFFLLYKLDSGKKAYSSEIFKVQIVEPS